MFRLFKGIFLVGLLYLASACGSDPGPFEMSTSTTMVIGEAPSSPVQFIINPEEQSGQGVLSADIAQQFSNRRDLTIQSFDIELDFPGVGPVAIRLNPNFESTATVFMLNFNNQPAGTHTMNLFLIIETPDQNLTLDNVQLASNTATLTLVDPLPVLTFFFQGQPKQLQITSLQAVIPAQLISSLIDPN
jgi:hypothetical protein